MRCGNETLTRYVGDLVFLVRLPRTPTSRATHMLQPIHRIKLRSAGHGVVLSPIPWGRIIHNKEGTEMMVRAQGAKLEVTDSEAFKAELSDGTAMLEFEGRPDAPFLAISYRGPADSPEQLGPVPWH